MAGQMTDVGVALELYLTSSTKRGNHRIIFISGAEECLAARRGQKMALLALTLSKLNVN